MIKIAFFNYSAQMGGAEHSLLGLLKRINRDRFSPLLIHTENGPFIEKIKAISIECIYLPLSFDISVYQREKLIRGIILNPSILIKLRKWKKEFAQILAERNVDFVHANQPKSHLLTMLSLRNQCPYLLHLRDMFGKLSFARVAYRLLFSKKNGHAAAISKAVAHRFPKKIRNNLKVIYNGTAISTSIAGNLNIREELGLPRGARFICSAGRIVPWKRFDLLIKAFAKITAKFPDLFLIILGDPIYWGNEHRDFLHKMAKSSKAAKKIIFKGYVENIADYFKASEFIVLPSLNEPFGRVLIEAMACSKPVIAFNSGGIPEIVSHLENGLLVSDSNAEALSDAIEWMLSNPDKAVEMGDAARQHVIDSFSIKSHTHAMEAYFTEIVEAHARSAT